MTSTVATVATNVKNRLGIATGGAVGTSNEPTNAVVGGWFQDASKQLIGDLNPILQITTSAIAAKALTLANDRIFYVEVDQTPLIRGTEYGSTSAGLTFRDPALNNETANIFYFKQIDVSGLTFDTSCIFGTDWLEELATVMASQQACLRMSNTAESQQGAFFAGLYRVLETERDMLYKAHKQQWDMQMQTFDKWVQWRLQYGKRPLPESAYAGFRNRSKVVNDLFGRD